MGCSKLPWTIQKTTESAAPTTEKESTDMDTELSHLKTGTIDFDTFYVLTRQHWDRLSAALFRKAKHRLQGSADLEDILQEMLMSIQPSVDKFDAARTSMTLKKFVIWHASVAANDFVSRQCGAYKHRTASPPRAPTIMACLGSRAHGTSGDDDGDTTKMGRNGTGRSDMTIDLMATVDADQEWVVDVKARRAAVCKTMVEHIVMEQLFNVGASLADIADSIYNDDSLRERLNLQTQKKTYGLVRRVTAQFADRASCMA